MERGDKYNNLALIVLVGSVLYANTIGVPFYYDDSHAIVNNLNIRSMSNAFERVFLSRGLSYFTFAINYAVSDLNVWSFHVFNILIHIASGVAIYFLLKKIFDDSEFLALSGALLFLVHPLQTQAVTYIVQRMASLASLLVFCAVYCFIVAREVYLLSGFWSRRHLAWYVTSVLLGVLAVISKENAVIFPLLFCLSAWYCDRDDFSFRQLLIYLSPLVALGCLGGLWLFLFSGIDFSFALRTAEIFVQGNPPYPELASRIELVHLRYFMTEMMVFWKYLQLLVFPMGQLLDYSYPLVEKIVDFKAILAGLSLVVLVILTFLSRNRRYVFALLWVLICLSVESSFIPLEPLFEHRLYMPMLGFVVFFNESIIGRLGRKKGMVVTTVLILFLALLTLIRNNQWNDPVSFWKSNSDQVPYNYRTKLALSIALADAGRELESMRIVEEVLAAPPYPVMVESNVYRESMLELGKAYVRQRRVNDAVALFEKGEKLYPRVGAFKFYLAAIYNEQGFSARGLAYLKQAYQLEPDNSIIREQYEQSLDRKFQ